MSTVILSYIYIYINVCVYMAASILQTLNACIIWVINKTKWKSAEYYRQILLSGCVMRHYEECFDF